MFEPVNDLEKSLMNAAKNPSGRPQFIRDLLEAKIFVIQAGGDNLNIKDNVLQQGATLKLEPIQKDGRSWLPIFTSLERLQQFVRSEVTYLQFNARDFFTMTRGAYIILNPGADYRKEFFPEEIEQMLNGSIFQPSQTYTAEKETKVLIGQPSVYPHELVKALAEYFATNKQVNRAYLAQFFNSAVDTKSHLLIGIDASGDFDKAVGDAGLICTQVMGKDEVIDFMRLDNSGVSKYMINQTKPIYQKSSFLKKLFGS